HPVGYMQISCESMREDVAAIHAQQRAIGYESIFIEGAAESERYMKGLFSDWRAQGITSVLHEMPGGYANNSLAMLGLAAKAEALGVRIISGITVKALESDNSGAIAAVVTDQGRMECDYAVVAAGPWVRSFWEMLELPMEVSIRNAATGEISEDIPMWIYWSLQEGTLGVDPTLQVTNDGHMPPVIHVDTDAPLHSDHDGRRLTDTMVGRPLLSSTSKRARWRWTPTARTHQNLWWGPNLPRCGCRPSPIVSSASPVPCLTSKQNLRGALARSHLIASRCSTPCARIAS
ncbi:FAD-dependent oxidoreductase, partial [Luminiphilus sp.]|nr:FAD-dependent oxidoreductase [Luminiphilus sp.]